MSNLLPLLEKLQAAQKANQEQLESKKQQNIMNQFVRALEGMGRVEMMKGEKGDKPIAGVDYPIPQDGTDGYTPIKGVDYFDGENGVDGENGEDGKDGVDGKDADMSEVKPIVLDITERQTAKVMKSHEKEFDHSKIGFVGTKKVSEAGMKDGQVLTYDATKDLLHYTTLQQIAKRVSGVMGRGFSLPSQEGNSGKVLSTDGSDPSWITPSSSQDVFKTISVAGQSDVVADATTDTLTLVAGTNVTITTNATTDTITINGSAGGSGITRSVNSISTTTTAAAVASTDYVYIVTTATTLTLPTAVGNTNLYVCKNNSSGTATVDTTSSQTIDGSLSVTMPVQYTSLSFISDGSNWSIV